MIEINWAFNIGHILQDESIVNSLDIDFDLLSSLSKETNNRKNVIFKRCPAHADFLRNTFVFKSPFDINLSIDIDENRSSVISSNLNQILFDRIIDFRFLDKNEKGESPYPILGIDFLNSFISDSPLLLETLPAFLHYNDFTSKCSVIPGEFDIHKWVRPVELVFESKLNKTEITIKKGDALCYFKFRTDDIVKIEKNQMPWDEIIKCNEIRKAAPWQPLKERYRSYLNYKINNEQ